MGWDSGQLWEKGSQLKTLSNGANTVTFNDIQISGVTGVTALKTKIEVWLGNALVCESAVHIQNNLPVPNPSVELATQTFASTTIQWTSAAVIDQYVVEIKKGNGTPTTHSAAGLSYTFATDHTTAYQYSVSVKDSVVWSTGKTFESPSGKVSNLEASDRTESSVYIKWPAIAGATGYDVKLVQAGITVYDWTSNGTIREKTYTKLKATTTYMVWFRA